MKATASARAAARRPPMNPRLALRLAQMMSGVGYFVREVGRNAIRAKATKISIDTEDARGEPVLTIFDNGAGMAPEDRQRFGEELGWSEDDIGNGTGARWTAVALAQRLEVYTVHEGEPDFVYHIVLPLVRFVLEIQEGRWEGAWDRLPRSRTRFPQDASHGTLLILSDFRATDPADPALKRTRSTANQVTPENIRRHVLTHFASPDHAKRFVVCGTWVKPKQLEGFPLWKESVTAKAGLGEVCGEVRLSGTAAGNWLTIGGVEASVPFANLVKGFADEAPELAARIPRRFLDRRVIGFIRIGVLERFSTPDREHLQGTFFTSPEARMVVDELIRIGAKLEDGMRRYEAQPTSHVTESYISSFVARIHAAQGFTGASAPGGEGTGQVPRVEPPPMLKVYPAEAHLDPWDGKGERDSLVIVVSNPLAGETFSWDDKGAGLLGTKTGPQVTARAPRNQGVFLVTARSDLHSERSATMRLDVRYHVDTPPPDEHTFCLTPRSTSAYVGQERTVRVKQQGPSSGKYDWRVEPERERGEPLCQLVVQPGGREVKFTGFKPGKHKVSCADSKDHKIVATATIEVLARREENPDGPLPGPEDPTGCGGVGTGEEAAERSSAAGTLLHFRFRGVDYTFRLRSDAGIVDPFYVEELNRRIHVGDRVLALLDDHEAKDLHTAHYAATGIELLLQAEGVLAPEDFSGHAELHRVILEIVMPKKNGDRPKA